MLGRGVCMAWGHAWQRVCMAVGASMAEGMHGRGASMAWGHAWWGVCMAGGHAWQGGMHDRRVCVVGSVCGRGDSHCSGRYASYWNAFLFSWNNFLF